VDDATQSIAVTTAEAATKIDSDWKAELSTWRERAISDRQEHDEKFAEELATLVAAAQIGQRLVEHAAGSLTALTWTSRATRERRIGSRTRVLAVCTFLLAAVFGIWMVAEALTESLTVGEGLLRLGVVAAITGLGGYLAAEARRHLHEADSAEEVSAVITQMEPFLAGSGDRDAVRREISETVFVRNVLSRFTRRDAVGKQIAEQNMPEVIGALTDSVKKLSSK
jgi:hypothetical protein